MAAMPFKDLRRVMIVDDHPVFREGLRAIVESIAGLVVCADAGDARTALQGLRSWRPDVALVDIALPGADGLEVIKGMLAEQPGLIVLVVSMHDEGVYALRALRAGARGYVMKQHALETVPKALAQVLEGKLYVSPTLLDRITRQAIQETHGDYGVPVEALSERELEILTRYGHGETTNQIAENLELSIKTVDTHRTHIKEKLGFKNAEEMTRFAGEWVASGEATGSGREADAQQE